MNVQNFTGQIADHIVKGRFRASFQPRESEKQSQLRVSELIRFSMEKKISPSVISAKALDRAMEASLKKYRNGEFLLPHLINRSRYIGNYRDMLTEYVDDATSLSKGRVVLATLCKRDHTKEQDHIASFLKGLGFSTIELGSGNSIDDVIQSIKNNAPDILYITLPARSPVPKANVMYSMHSTPDIRKVIDRISKEGCREDITIIIGGYVAGIESAKKTGADYCCKDLFQAIDLFTTIYKADR